MIIHAEKRGEAACVYYRSFEVRLIKNMNFLRDRYKTGLDKIQETNVVIDEMQQTLTELEPELKEKSAATEALMIKLDKDKDEANAVREVVSEDERVANIKATETKAIKDDAQSLG